MKQVPQAFNCCENQRTYNYPALKSVLTIAGFDPSGGAGLQADLKTIHALGGYGLSVASAITVQNSQGVQSSHPLPSAQVRAQLECLLADVKPDAIKIGMLATGETVRTILPILAQIDCPIVLDPVLISSSGRELLERHAWKDLQDLAQIATLLTPNLPEIEALSGQNFTELSNASWMPLTQLGWQNVLIKGGHSDSTEQATDYLIRDLQHKAQLDSFSHAKVASQHNHGTGCTLASAIATQLAFGLNLTEAVAQAKHYLTQALIHAAQGQPTYLDQQCSRHGGLYHDFQNRN